MGNVGSQDNFVDTQNSKLTNITDSLTYTQLTDLVADIDSNVTKHHLTDDTVDNVFDLYSNFIQGNMWVTNPEWAALVVLTVDVAGVRPSRIWQLELIDQSNTVVTTSINGQLKTLRLIDIGIGVIQLFFRIEGDEVLSIA